MPVTSRIRAGAWAGDEAAVSAATPVARLTTAPSGIGARARRRGDFRGATASSSMVIIESFLQTLGCGRHEGMEVCRLRLSYDLGQARPRRRTGPEPCPSAGLHIAQGD